MSISITTLPDREDSGANQLLEKHGQIMANQYECHLIKSATSSAAQVDEMPQCR